MLGHNSPWVLPGGGQAAYLQALEEANLEPDQWESVQGLHWSACRFRPYMLIPSGESRGTGK